MCGKLQQETPEDKRLFFFLIYICVCVYMYKKSSVSYNDSVLFGVFTIPHVFSYQKHGKIDF